MTGSRARRVAQAVVLACAGLAALAVQGIAHAADPWPSRPIRLIVSFGAGGPMDTLGRLLAQQLGPALGQPVVVENRVGAAGNIGLDALARATPDGYTIGLVGTSAIASAIVSPDKAVDPVKAFAPVGKLVEQPLLIVVAANVPANDLGELIGLARRDPDHLSYSTQGIGTPPHVAGLLLWRRAGVTLQHIPYSGTAQTYKDVITGEVPLTISFVNLLKPFVQTGQLRALAVTSAQRAAALPEVPTVAESGYPGYEVGSWLGMVVPAGTPRGAIERLNAELQRILAQPEMRTQLASLGMEPVPSSPEKMAADMRATAQAWGPLISALGANPK